jgi:hypothetical protein
MLAAKKIIYAPVNKNMYKKIKPFISLIFFMHHISHLKFFMPDSFLEYSFYVLFFKVQNVISKQLFFLKSV